MPGNDISYRRLAKCLIEVDGVDVTDRLDPHLLSVEVIDKLGAVDMCSIELDDRDASLRMPPTGAPLGIWLGWSFDGPSLPNDYVQPINPWTLTDAKSSELPYVGSLGLVFIGEVSEVESGFARRGGGRRLWIEGKSFDQLGHAKSPRQKTWGQGDTGGGGGGIPFSQVAKELGSKAGFNVNIADSIGGKTRNFWAADGESFMHFMNRMGRELGGDLKFQGNNVHMVDKTNTLSANGLEFPSVEAEWGYNLLAWRIKPFIPRAQFQQSRATHFNAPMGKVMETITRHAAPGLPFGNAIAQSQMPGMAPNRQTGGHHGQGEAAGAGKRRSHGWVTIHGEPRARAHGAMIIIGARPGIDGVYSIDEAIHHYSRTGYTTRCELGMALFPSGAGYESWAKALYERSGSWVLSEEEWNRIQEKQDPSIPQPTPNPDNPWENQNPDGTVST